MSSIEAMSRGLCCATELNSNMLKILPDHPFININKDNMYHELSYVITNPKILKSYKESAYRWVKKNHDINSVATTLYNYYTLISK